MQEKNPSQASWFKDILFLQKGFKVEFLCCLTMPGLSKDIRRHTRHLYSYQRLSIIIISITIIVIIAIIISFLAILFPLPLLLYFKINLQKGFGMGQSMTMAGKFWFKQYFQTTDKQYKYYTNRAYKFCDISHAQ